MAHIPGSTQKKRPRTATLVPVAMTLLATPATAQVAPPAPPAAAASEPTETLAPVRITGRAPADASVAGWGDVPLSQAPLQATTIDAAQIRESGVRRLSDL